LLSKLSQKDIDHKNLQKQHYDLKADWDILNSQIKELKLILTKSESDAVQNSASIKNSYIKIIDEKDKQIRNVIHEKEMLKE